MRNFLFIDRKLFYFQTIFVRIKNERREKLNLIISVLNGGNNQVKKVRVALLALAVVCLAAIIPVSSLAVAQDFPDVRTHWARDYILALAEKGGIAGMPDGSFLPEDNVTFPQFVKIIIGCEYGEIGPVDGGDWVSGFMQKAREVGIIDLTDMEYTGDITRNDAARVVADSLIHIYGEEAAADTSIVEEFEDYPSCRSCLGFFHSVVGECYVKGIITGKPGPIFDGEANLTRAEACAIIMRMMDPSLRIPPDGLLSSEDE